jgi:UDP-N-acetylmuramate dehydrogenase
MEEALAFIREKGIPLLVMGGGTNILIDDKGFPGAVVKCEIDVMERTGCFVRAGAGAMVSELTDFCSREGLSGLEWAGGLPGTVGGGVRGNAGAFGGEMKDRI